MGNPAELPPDLAEYLSSFPPLTPADYEELAEAARQLDRDPQFRDDVARGLILELVLEIEEYARITRFDESDNSFSAARP